MTEVGDAGGRTSKAGLTEEFLSAVVGMEGRREDVLAIRRRWFAFVYLGDLPLGEEGFNECQHVPSCFDEGLVLTCDVATCEASLFRFEPFVYPADAMAHETVELITWANELGGTEYTEVERALALVEMTAVETERRWVLLAGIPIPSGGDEPAPDAALELAAPLVDGLRIEANGEFPRLTRESVLPAFIAGNDEGHGALTDVSVVVSEGNMPRGELDSDTVDRAVSIGLWSRLDDPVVRFLDLLQASGSDLNSRGDYMSAVLKAAVAAEILIKHIAWGILWETSGRDSLSNTKKKLFPADLIDTVLAKSLPNNWSDEPSGSPVHLWKVSTRDLRNEIVHEGHDPTGVEASDAIVATYALGEHVLSTLCDARADYPKTALLWATKQLIDRGVHDSHVESVDPRIAAEGHLSPTKQALLRSYLEFVSPRAESAKPE